MVAEGGGSGAPGVSEITLLKMNKCDIGPGSRDYDGGHYRHAQVAQL